MNNNDNSSKSQNNLDWRGEPIRWIGEASKDVVGVGAGMRNGEGEDLFERPCIAPLNLDRWTMSLSDVKRMVSLSAA